MRVLALLAASVAAASLPRAPLGIDAPLVAVLVAATVATSTRRSLDAALFGSLAVALACVPALLDADWVLAVDIAAACLLAAVAVTGPRLVAPLAPFRALGQLPDLVPAVPHRSAPVLRGLVLGAVVVLPFGVLFWTADAAFAEIGRAAPIPSLASVPARVFVFTLVLLGALGLALAAKRVFADPDMPKPKLGLSEWAIPLVLLDALFLAFVLVQVTVLFGGRDHVLETAGLTYAEYARQGFWQLIAAAALTLVVVAAALRVAEVRRPSHGILLRALLGALCVLTIVTVASALHRLDLYEDAFGLTRARLAAEAFSWGLGAFFVLILVAGAVHTVRKQVARIAVAGVAFGLFAFSLSNPDGRIAGRNVDRWRGTGDLDIDYVQGLSADAVPSLAKLPEPLRAEVLAPFRARLAEDEPWSSANYGRHRAREVLEP
ncbi:MAG: DUF4173 domain-containing protein [Gaiellaceae bacterium]